MSSNVLALIPARGGSKGIPRKNLVELAGKPLLQYTIDAALGSKVIDRVVLSTDDSTIADYGIANGLEVPYQRPSDLAQDDTPMLPVIQHAVSWLAEHDDWHTDIVVLLQPTSPLRTSKHIDAATELLTTTGADTVVSIIPVPHHFNPLSIMQVSDKGQLTPYVNGPLILRRQDKPLVYARNGPAVLVIRRDTLDKSGLYGDDVRGFVMSERDSIDIDTQEDLLLAAFWLQHRQST